MRRAAANSPNLNFEHIFPEWILRQYNKASQFSYSTGFERQRQKFYSHKLKVHTDCNSKFGRLIETPISKGQFDDADTFWALAPQLMRHGEFANTAMYSVIEIEYLFEEPNFYYHIHHELGVMWIAFGARSFVVFYRSLLGVEEIDQYKKFWKQIDIDAKRNGEKLPPQVRYNIFCARIAIDHYFAGSGLSFDFSQNYNHGVPTRPAHTPENEDIFYKSFGLKPIRRSGRIVKWEMIPSDA